MKKLLLIIVFAILGSCNYAYGQCTAPPGFQCVSNEIMSRTAKALDEIPPLRVLVEKLTTQVGLQDKQITALLNQIKAQSDAFDAAMNYAKSEQILADAALKLANTAIELTQKLQSKIDKPKTGFAKLLDILEKVVLIAVGVSIGKGL